MNDLPSDDIETPIGGVADFRIDAQGRWYHDGAPITRKALAELFARRALKIDESGRYWLQTPYEKYPVEVEDVPFIIVDYRHEADMIVMTTNFDEEVCIGPEHPLELRAGLPYIEVRDGLYAKVSRSVYYNLVEEFGSSLKSSGRTYSLGDES